MNDKDADEVIEFNKEKTTRTYGGDQNKKIDSENNNEDDTHEIIKFNKGRTSKVYEINEDRKKV